MNARLAVIAALADGSVKSSSPGQVPDRQQGDRGFHAHAGPQEIFQGLRKKGHD